MRSRTVLAPGRREPCKGRLLTAHRAPRRALALLRNWLNKDKCLAMPYRIGDWLQRLVHRKNAGALRAGEARADRSSYVFREPAPPGAAPALCRTGALVRAGPGAVAAVTSNSAACA